jgi:hypothetical protein
VTTHEVTYGGRRYVVTQNADGSFNWPDGLLREHLISRTVAANVLKYGTGALNIDGCRVASPGPVVGDGRRRDGETSSDTRYADRGATSFAPLPGVRGGDPSGRWPSNILLTHSAACLMTGTREVAGNLRVNPTTQAARANVAKGAERERLRGPRGYGNPDGTETVESWSCAPDCPVAELDRQSGVLTSGANPERRGSDKLRDAYGDFAGQPECVAHRGADAGGASRFFPVFRYEAKAPASERPRIRLKVMRLRADLSEETRAYVADELRRAGVDVA